MDSRSPDSVRQSPGALGIPGGRNEPPSRRENWQAFFGRETPENTARAYLRRVLANVRRVIGDHKAEPPFLLIDRQTIQFNQAGDYWLDFQSSSQH